MYGYCFPTGLENRNIFLNFQINDTNITQDQHKPTNNVQLICKLTIAPSLQ